MASDKPPNLWQCIWCGRRLGEDKVPHRCKGNLRKRKLFMWYLGDAPELQRQNAYDYNRFKYLRWNSFYRGYK